MRSVGLELWISFSLGLGKPQDDLKMAEASATDGP